MVRGSVGVMVVMSSYFAHNYFQHVLIANSKVLRMSLSPVTRSLVCLIIIDYFMNEFTFKVLKAAICAAASCATGKAFESVVNRFTKTVKSMK